ncbi:MAG TPA: protein kinase [Planctomycetota bacterium]|nr:protein kinase [Planctomycetota bacterium]
MSEPLTERALQRLLAMAAAENDAPAAPSLPPRYELVREIGRGGMGVVYEVIDHQLGRHCALKTLGAGAGTDDEGRRRFAREALAAARLRHPHIAAVYDATPDYITMQLVDGKPIAAAPAIAPRLAVELVRDAALALQHAHEQGIVHRDVKPSNLLVEGRHVYVVDFGLARAIDAASSVSLSGAVVGTPAFMPPEQALGHGDRIDARSDVYGVGATLYHCLAGTPPFTARDLPALLRRVVEDDPKPVARDRDLDLVLAKCLAKEPERRYQSARELAEDLDRWLRHETVRARPTSFFYRVRKRLQRHRALAWAALGAVALTALVLGPIALYESAARAAANEAVELAGHVATVLQEAEQFRRLGDSDSASEELKTGINHTREFLGRHEVPRAHYLLGRLLRAHDEPDDALIELDLALESEPDLAEARFERGLLLAARNELEPGERATAIADLGAAVGARSVLRDVDLLFGMAELAKLRGEHQQAMELLKEVLEYDAMHVPARAALAKAARVLGQSGLALYYSASALNVQQGFGPLFLARERTTLPTSILGLEGALVDYSDKLPADHAPALAWRGLAQLRRALRLEREGSLGEALEAALCSVDDHDSTLKLHRDLAGALNNRAVCSMVVDRLQAKAGNGAAAAEARARAGADAAAAIELAQEMPAVHFNAGLVALRQATVLRALGRVEAAATQAEAAQRAFTTARSLAPEEWPHAATCAQRFADAATIVAAPR